MNAVDEWIVECGQRRREIVSGGSDLRADLRAVPRAPVVAAARRRCAAATQTEELRRGGTSEVRHAPGQDLFRKGFPAGRARSPIVADVFGQVTANNRFFQDSFKILSRFFQDFRHFLEFFGLFIDFNYLIIFQWLFDLNFWIIFTSFFYFNFWIKLNC